jgi:hypothetical protein
MSNPWGYAIKGFDEGVDLGVRSYDKAQRKKERAENIQIGKSQAEKTDKYRTDESRRADTQLGIATTKASQDTETFNAKKASDKARRTLNVARAQVANDNEFEAASTLSKHYNEEVPNGDEVRIFQRKFSGDNPAFDGVPKNKNVVVQSKTGGVTTFKDINAAIEHAAGMSDVKSITQAYETSRNALAQKNAAASESPFVGKDGNQYISTYKMGKGGIPVLDKEIPYTGKKGTPSTRTALGRQLGKPATDEQTEVALGLRNKAEASSVTGTEAETLKGKILANDAKTLEILFKTFKKGEKTVYDFDKGVFTTEGGNAITEAQRIVNKPAGDLTTEERQKLPKAVKALAFYDEVSAKATKSKPPVPGAKKSNKDGMWYVKKDSKWFKVESDN